MPRENSQGREIMPEVPVNGKVLVWAREIRGLDASSAAELLDITLEELAAYESGSKKPLVGFLRLMSSKYQINFTSLLMPAPLPIGERPVDHRSRARKRALSIETLVAIEEVSESLEVFKDIASESRKLIPRLAIGTVDLKEDPEEVANRERKRFGISLDEQRRWKSLGDARRRWREHIEDHGIFTYMIPMPLEEISGFSILHDDIAAICVNDREPTEGAKTFTLFHEYCHLLLRQTGISDEDDSNAVEKFCNQFAGSFLIPRTNLAEAIENVAIPHNFSVSAVRKLATRFKVSNRAMAFRLEETGLAPSGFYRTRTRLWDIPKQHEETTSKKQPSPVILRIKRLGRLHASTVLSALDKKIINSFDASELIGLQPSVLPKVEARLG